MTAPDTDSGLAAFQDAVAFFQSRLDTDLSDLDNEVTSHDTPHEHYREERGWSDETISEAGVGWAPANEMALLDHLMQKGYGREAILGTGLFWDGLEPIWTGRFVLPYFNAEGRPVFAISRRAGTGHPRDDAAAYGGDEAAKYHKIPIHREEMEVGVAPREPIYGLRTLDRDGPVIITEGIADAIQAHQAGYACLSPVTTQFKHEHREALLDSLREADRRVFIIQDAEYPKAELADGAEEWGDLGLEQFGEGVKGAVRTAAHLAEGGIDAYLAELPQPDAEKIDLDDYLGGWGDTLAPVLASAKPADQHPAFEAETGGGTSTSGGGDSEWRSSSDDRNDDAGDRDLSREAVEDALSHVNKTLSYDDWIQLAYAVHDWDDSATGRQVFEAWSRTSPKWDEPESPQAIEWVWKNATAGGRTTVATLIHRAQEGGWTPPKPDTTPRGANYPVVECEPPQIETVEYDIEERRDEIEGERYQEASEATAPYIVGDPAGTGKSTGLPRGAANAGRSHTVLFPTHQKGREFITDDHSPEDYYHVKGAEQYREDEHMDLDHADRVEPPDDAPHMCPVYDLPPEDDLRLRFQQQMEWLGIMPTHLDHAEELADHDHGPDGGCTWTHQFSEADDADRIVGVHEYQTLKTVVGGDRDVIIDESTGTLKRDQKLTIDQLVRLGNELDNIGDLPGMPGGLHAFARFTRDVVDVFTNSEGADGLADLDPPDVEGRTVREYPGQEYREGYREREVLAEGLAELKFAFHDTLRERFKRDAWEGTPLGFDALLAAAIEAGLDATAARQVIALPPVLTDCPRCSTGLSAHDGRRVCGECGWIEGEDFYTTRDSEPARALAWCEQFDGGGETPGRLVFEWLPLVGDLPDDPIIADATPTPRKTAAMYGADPADVTVSGDDDLDIPNLRVTQVLDGQFHAGTIKKAIEEDRTLAARIQRAIDLIAQAHRKPLYVIKKGLRQHFDFPEDAEVVHYHALRGLNRNDCDAVVCIGAPHPNVDDLRRVAELLAQGRDDIRAGGEARSSNPHEEGEPVYRKLRYEDDDGIGRAVPTKTYTGLTGDLFEEGRRKELEQAVHRIRPLLADEMKHAYLLTNVPTDLPVDEVSTFEELADPVKALLPVPERALDLAECIRDVAAGDAPDGFRADQLVGRDGDGEATFRVSELHGLAQANRIDVCEKTVRRWKDGLVELGLLDAGDYDQRRGVPYTADAATLTSALSVVTNNGSVEVALKRRIRRLAADADGTLDWLAAAREAFGLSGDRCTLGRGDPPPG